MKKILCIIVTLILAIGLFAVFVSAATVKTTFDLSTLDLSAGEHTITVKAKADGYKTSEASNAVEYTVSSGYTVTFKWSAVSDRGVCYYSLNGTDYTVMTDGLVLENVTSIWFKCLSFDDGCNGGECSWTNPVGRCCGIDYDTLMYSDAESGEIVLTGNMVVTYGNSLNPI